MTQDEIIRMAQINELIKESARLIASTSDEGDRYLTAVDTLRNAYRLGLKDATIVAAHWQKIHQQEMSMMSELCADRILEEREACAKVCETEHDKSKFGVNGMHCAAAIRARGDINEHAI